MVYDMVGRTIIQVEWIDGLTANITLDDDTTIEVHHVRIKTKEEQLDIIENEITKLQTTLARKLEIKAVLDGKVIKEPILEEPILDEPVVKGI